ncbi:phage tail protein [Pseudomonas kurunegalensis]|uniref:phage tail protein n=1 Tax=Pseudomonas kurunegalensis TaxID=485880 RepID=UPI002117528C|nr:phage tail protein [Pseudomonas kurunegalensis]
MIKLELKFWLAGTELSKLRDAAQAWWERVESWVSWPLQQLDAETCHLVVLDLMAWQRDITRFRGEPESSYRLRVKYAFINAVDAGSTIGFKRIFQRLGIGALEIRERQADRDWDVVQLLLSDQQLSDNSALLDIVIQQYGRTCRRYEFVGTTELTLGLEAHEFGHDQVTLTARFDDDHTIGLYVASYEFNHDHMTLVAS